MEIYNNALNNLDDESSYYDIKLVFNNNETLYSNKHFLCFISPVLNNIIKYDIKNSNIFNINNKKYDYVKIILAFCYPLIDFNIILKEVKINASIIKIIDEWCMHDLNNKIEEFYCLNVEKYNIDTLYYFSLSCNFKKLKEIILEKSSIKKYNLIKDSKNWNNLSIMQKYELSESVINNLKKRKFGVYE